MAEINALDRVVAECAREIAAQDASSDFAALIRIIDAQAAEIERLRDALGALHGAMQRRHYGRMPDEVQRAFDAAGAALKGTK